MVMIQMVRAGDGGVAGEGGQTDGDGWLVLGLALLPFPFGPVDLHVLIVVSGISAGGGVGATVGPWRNPVEVLA